MMNSNQNQTKQDYGTLRHSKGDVLLGNAKKEREAASPGGAGK